VEELLTKRVSRIESPRHRKSSASNISQAFKYLAENTEEIPRDSALGVKLHATDVVVRPIQSAAELDEVYKLTYVSYREREYCPPQEDGRLVHYPHLDRIPETTILVAVADKEIIGSISLTQDGPHGLHVDEDFKIVCSQVRNEGSPIAASWRIVTRSGVRSERKIVMALITGCAIRLIASCALTYLYTFNPRHERIYERLLNMKTIARKEGNIDGLYNSPAVLMRNSKEDLEHFLVRRNRRNKQSVA